MVWIQNYDPFSDWRLSTAVAAVPVLLLLALLAVGRLTRLEGRPDCRIDRGSAGLPRLPDAGGDGARERRRGYGLCAGAASSG